VPLAWRQCSRSLLDEDWAHVLYLVGEDGRSTGEATAVVVEWIVAALDLAFAAIVPYSTS
jgi:hypothetical protein